MDRTLKILMVCHKPWEGAYARSHAMAKQLVQRGHRVTLLLISRKRRFGFSVFDWDGVRAVDTPDLLWGPLRTGWNPWNAVSRILFLDRDPETNDLIHCYETRPATIYPVLHLVRRCNPPWLTDWNDWWGRKGLIEVNRPRWYRLLLGWLETYYEEAFRSRAEGLTVISKGLERRAIGLGVRPERICTLHGGTFPDWYQARPKEECRRRVGFSLEDPLLGFSSARPRLDLDVVLAALAIVALRLPTVKLLVAGRPGKEIQELVKAHGVQRNVCLLGYLTDDDLPRSLGCADVFLLPSPTLQPGEVAEQDWRLHEPGTPNRFQSGGRHQGAVREQCNWVPGRVGRTRLRRQDRLPAGESEDFRGAGAFRPKSCCGGI